MLLKPYEIARNVFSEKKHLGKKEYDRLELALERLKAVFIKFVGIFYQDSHRTTRYFSILDDVIIDSKNKKVVLRFNEQYLTQQRETRYYQNIDLEEYKAMKRPLSCRLYEILTKSFLENPLWYVKIDNLAEKLTLTKPQGSDSYYPSKVLVALRPAINEINKKTKLTVELQYDKQNETCVFKKTKADKITTKIFSQKAQKGIHEPEKIAETLNGYGFSPAKVQKVIKGYSPEKIEEKINLLKQSKNIHNPVAWLLRALEEDWNNQINQSSFQYKDRNFNGPRKKLKYDNILHRQNALEAFEKLSQSAQAKINKQFEKWATTYGTGSLSIQECRASFLVKKLLEKNTDFT